MTSVYLTDGSGSENVSDIERLFFDYFSNLVSESHIPDPGLLGRTLETFCAKVPQLSISVSEDHLIPTTLAEVHSALGAMKAGSAPGPDGLPTEFC